MCGEKHGNDESWWKDAEWSEARKKLGMSVDENPIDYKILNF